MDLARQTKLDEVALRRLNAVGGGHMDDWWVYRGVIRPKQFVSIEFLDEGRVPAAEQRMIEAARTARTSAYAMSILNVS